MIINPTKKTQALFSALPKVADSKEAKAFSLTNPFFSWHANYYNVNRKKILVLVNDLTMISVVIADVNAKNKKELATDIRMGIEQGFKQEGASEQEIEQYFQLAGEVVINAGFNRPVTGVTTRFVQEAEGFPIDFSTRIQSNLMRWLADTPIQPLPESFPQLALEKAMKNNLVCLPIDPKHLETSKKKSDYQVVVTWKSFSEWGKYAEKGWFGGYESTVSAVEKNNQLVLEAFQQYLSEGAGLSDKVVRRHMENTAFFLNSYLTYSSIHTPVTDFFDVEDFLSDFYPRKDWDASPAGVKRMGASMKKFYQFLVAAKVITEKEWEEVKEHIAMGVEIGMSNLEMMNDISQFF